MAYPRWRATDARAAAAARSGVNLLAATPAALAEACSDGDASSVADDPGRCTRTRRVAHECDRPAHLRRRERSPAKRSDLRDQRQLRRKVNKRDAWLRFCEAIRRVDVNRLKASDVRHTEDCNMPGRIIRTFLLVFVVATVGAAATQKAQLAKESPQSARLERALAGAEEG